MTRVAAVLAWLLAVGLLAPATADAASTPTATTTSATTVPRTVIGDGTPRGCTSAAVVAAVRRGGHITFDCGPSPVRIVMRRTAKVVNTSRTVIIDGGGKVTLDGRFKRRILYMNTCDRRQVWATSDCNRQPFPRLVVQNITLTRGWARGRTAEDGGGAIFVRGGRFAAADVAFVNNRCAKVGPDVGGGALRIVLQQSGRAATVRDSTFTGGRCSNGGAISVLHANLRVTRSTFTGNRATGRGLNPARTGTPGGGSGGALYADGNRLRIRLSGVTMQGNWARSGPGAIFFVSNDRTGTLRIHRSTLVGNRGSLNTLPGIFYLGRGNRPAVTKSVIG